MAHSEISVPIPTRLFLELCEFLRSRGSDRDPVDAVSLALDYWMQNAPWKAEDLLPDVTPKAGVMPTHEGYWWKTVFIPAGSKARMIYKGKSFFAQVTSEGFLFEGAAYSPSEFIHHVTQTSRNAWRDIELQFPDKATWVLADDLRKRGF